MPTIRFETRAPQEARVERFRGSGADEGFRSIAAAGNALFSAGSQLEAMDRVAKEATQKVAAQEAADKFYLGTRQKLDALKVSLAEQQKEDTFASEAERLLQEETDSASQDFTGDKLFFGQARAPYAHLIREDINTTRRELMVRQGTRVLNSQAERLIGNSSGDLTSLTHEFETLRGHAKSLKAGFVIDDKAYRDVVGQALTKTLETRNKFLYTNYPEDAKSIIASEAEHFNTLLRPIQDAELKDALAKGQEEYAKSLERKLQQDVVYESRPLEEVLEDARANNLDPGKIEQAWAEHHNRRFTVANHEEQKREKAVKLASDTLRTDLTLRASKDRSFDIRAVIDENRRSLTGDDTRALLDLAKANEKSLKAPEQSDTKALRQLKRLVYTNPNAGSTENAIFSAVERGDLSRGDYEQLLDKMYANRKELKNEDTAKKHQMFNEGQTALKHALTTTSIMEHDPISQGIATKWQDRLLFAQFGPELFAGDQAAFNANPGSFVKKIQTEARMELDQANATEAFRLLSAFPTFIDQETGALNRNKVVAAKAEKFIPAVDAERILLLDQLVKEGKVKWPYKPQPKVEPPPPPPEQSWFQKLFGGSTESKPTEQKKSDRKPEPKKKNF